MWHGWGSKEMLLVLVGNFEGKRPLGKLGCRSEENINIDFGLYGIYLVKDKREMDNSCENGNEIRVTLSAGKFMTSSRTLRSSRNTLFQCFLLD
jgi:hypothetical protein